MKGALLTSSIRVVLRGDAIGEKAHGQDAADVVAQTEKLLGGSKLAYSFILETMAGR